LSIVSGGFRYRGDDAHLVRYFCLGHLFIFSLALLLLELRFRKSEARSNLETAAVFVKPELTLNRTEFDQRIASGEQLVILDDLVLDVSRFMSEHPGGTFLIKHNIGRDISKFYYGGYALENRANQQPYTHSNLSR